MVHLPDVRLGPYLSDYIEGITHSVCTLEFEVHRPLYDWILDSLELPRPRPHQFEFARLNLTYTVMSKRKLIQLVNEKLVNGWDDPRMLTISGLRRRGVTAERLARLRLQHRDHEVSEHDRYGACSSTPCATSSIARHRAVSPCCNRSRLS